MKSLLSALVMTAAVMLAAFPVSASPITFFANLTGANEVPAVGSPGTGSATVVLDTDPLVHSLSVAVDFSGLTSPTTASHIHCCLASPFQTGVNVMVATAVPTFPGFPLNVTSGHYSQVFDLLDPATYNPAFIASNIFDPSHTVAGAATALAAGIQNGETYLNIHTVAFPTGEIRGFLAPVPEPTSLVLIATALAGLGLIRRRRKPL